MHLCWCAYVCGYLCDLCGAPHQVVDVAVEFQLPLRCHFFDVSATKDHLVRKTGGKERGEVYLLCHRIYCNSLQCYCIELASSR